MPGMGYQGPILYEMGRGINFIINQGPIWLLDGAHNFQLILPWPNCNLKYRHWLQRAFQTFLWVSRVQWLCSGELAAPWPCPRKIGSPGSKISGQNGLGLKFWTLTATKVRENTQLCLGWVTKVPYFTKWGMASILLLIRGPYVRQMVLMISRSFYLGQIAILNTDIGFRRHFGSFCVSAGFNGWFLGGWRPHGHAPENSSHQGPRNQAKMDLTWNSGLSPLPKLEKIPNYAWDGLPRSQTLQNGAWHPYHFEGWANTAARQSS